MSGARGSGGGGGGRGPVKIVFINTQYVEIDEMSFKSVVQELTGKDSRVCSSNNSNDILPASASIHGDSVLIRDLSFKEFDRLLKEMPPVDELYDGSWIY